jgi:endonuclease/exonuclease/phosphatase family metal-dependent hydrolase
MTSHFSLSSVARERAVDFMQQAGIGSERIQIFGGDLNAEPHEGAIQTLKKQGFQDAWSSLHVDENGFSFPACRPTKRIDYFFFRPSGRGETETLKSVSIIGKESLEELTLGVPAGGIELAPEVGMLDSKSLLWASDHFGLSFVIHRKHPRDNRKDEL